MVCFSKQGEIASKQRGSWGKESERARVIAACHELGARLISERQWQVLITRPLPYHCSLFQFAPIHCCISFKFIHFWKVNILGYVGWPDNRSDIATRFRISRFPTTHDRHPFFTLRTYPLHWYRNKHGFSGNSIVCSTILKGGMNRFSV